MKFLIENALPAAPVKKLANSQKVQVCRKIKNQDKNRAKRSDSERPDPDHDDG